MSKKFKAIALVSAMVLVLASCSNSNNANNSDDKSKGEVIEFNLDEGKLPDTITIDSLFKYDLSKLVEIDEYTGIAVTKTYTTVTEEDIENEIKRAVESATKMEEVKDRDDVRDGDITNIDYSGSLNGEEFEGGTAKGYDLTIGSKSFVGDFEEQLVGHKVGEEFDIKVTFPDPYQNNPDLAGKETVFKVKINKISKEVKAEFNDEFVKANSTKSKTTDEFREEVKTYLEETAEYNTNKQLENDVWSAILAKSSVVEYPEAYIAYYEDMLLSNFEFTLMQQGLDLDSFKKYYGYTDESFKSELNTQAKESVKALMVYQLLAKKENITITEAEYQEYLTKILENNNAKTEEELIKAEGNSVVGQIQNDLRLQKLIDYLVEKATVTEATAKPEADPSATPNSEVEPSATPNQ